MTEEDRRTVIAARLPVHEWTDRPLLITAVDATDGPFVLFDREASVPFVDAALVTVGSRGFMDGGMRSGAEADLAAGFDSIVIVAPLARAGSIPGPRFKPPRCAPRGARVVLVTPDADSVAAIGSSVLDPRGGHRRHTPAAAGGLGGCRDLSILVIGAGVRYRSQHGARRRSRSPMAVAGY